MQTRQQVILETIDNLMEVLDPSRRDVPDRSNIIDGSGRFPQTISPQDQWYKEKMFIERRPKNPRKPGYYPDTEGTADDLYPGLPSPRPFPRPDFPRPRPYPRPDFIRPRPYPDDEFDPRPFPRPRPYPGGGLKPRPFPRPDFPRPRPYPGDSDYFPQPHDGSGYFPKPDDKVPWPTPGGLKPEFVFPRKPTWVRPKPFPGGGFPRPDFPRPRPLPGGEKDYIPQRPYKPYDYVNPVPEKRNPEIRM